MSGFFRYEKRGQSIKIGGVNALCPPFLALCPPFLALCPPFLALCPPFLVPLSPLFLVSRSTA
jgi:hypothetical protein